MKTVIIFLLSVLMLFSCAEKSEVYKQLENADSLLMKDLVDSASTVLAVLNPQNAKDTAYYNILAFQIRYRGGRYIKSSAPIDYSIKYYLKNKDKEKLAMAYLCKACYFFSKDSLPDYLVILLKNAEKLAEQTTNYNLQNKVYNALAITNAIESVHQEAVKYARKEYQAALKSKNNRNIAYALIDLSIFYKDTDNYDSSDFYLSKCENMIKNLNNEDKAFVYNLLGEYYSGSDNHNSETYFLYSLKYKKMSDTYFNLAKLYYSQNQINKSEAYCDSSFMYALEKQKIDIYSLKIKNAICKNDFTKIVSLTDSIKKTQRIVSRKISENSILEMQKKFDFEKQKDKYEKILIIMILGLTISVVIIILIVVWNRLRVLKLKQYEGDLENSNRELQDNSAYLDEKINLYKTQISNLENMNGELSMRVENFEKFTTELKEENQKQLVSMKKTLAVMEKQVIANYEIGQKIYEKVVNNQTILNDAKLWGHFVNYYAMKHPDIIQTLKTFGKLLISEKVFIIVNEIKGADNSSMSIVLGISESTVRSRRSKLRKKQI